MVGLNQERGLPHHVSLIDRRMLDVTRIAVLCCALCGASCARTPAPVLGPSLRFFVQVVQDGEPCDIRDHTVRLRRIPFDLELVIEHGHGVSLNLSLEPTLHDRARGSKPLDDAFIPAKTMAESNHNPRQNLVIFTASEGNHHLVADTKASVNRCDQVDNVRGGYRCRRRVTTISFFDDTTWIHRKIEELPPTSIYVVFYMGRSIDGLSSSEIRRDHLRLVFE